MSFILTTEGLGMSCFCAFVLFGSFCVYLGACWIFNGFLMTTAVLEIRRMTLKTLIFLHDHFKPYTCLWQTDLQPVLKSGRQRGNTLTLTLSFFFSSFVLFSTTKIHISYRCCSIYLHSGPLYSRACEGGGCWGVAGKALKWPNVNHRILRQTWEPEKVIKDHKSAAIK